MVLGTLDEAVRPEIIEQLASQLSHRERARFSMEIMDALREDDAPAEKFHQVLRAWWVTVSIRQHSDFESQMKNWWRSRQALSDF